MSKTSRTTQESKPPSWAEGLFKQSGKEAERLWASGAGGNTYLGSTVAPLSDTTMQGVNQLAQAGQSWDTGATRPLFQQLGAGAVSNPYMQGLGDLAGMINPGSVDTSRIYGAAGQQTDTSGITRAGQAMTDTFGITRAGQGKTNVSGIQAGNVGTDHYQGVYDRAQQPSAAQQYLTPYASGQYLESGGNPYYRERLEGELSDAAANVQSQFAGAGRYGSGANTGVLGDTLGQMRLGALENDWNREQANQFNAVGMLDAANQAGLSQQLGAASGIAGIQSGNADRGLQAGIARAGFGAADLDRRLASAMGAAGFQAGDFDRALASAMGAAGFQADDLNRALQGALGGAGFEAGNFDRQLAGQGLQGNLLSSAGSMYGKGIDQGLGAAGAMAGLDQQNFENMLTGAGATLQAGGILDQHAQNQLADEINKFYALDNQDWTRLAMLQGAAAGAAGPYGTQLATSRQPMNVGGILGALAGMK